jgi:hypothetical protein
MADPVGGSDLKTRPQHTDRASADMGLIGMSRPQGCEVSSDKRNRSHAGHDADDRNAQHSRRRDGGNEPKAISQNHCGAGECNHRDRPFAKPAQFRPFKAELHGHHATLKNYAMELFDIA